MLRPTLLARSAVVLIAGAAILAPCASSAQASSAPHKPLAAAAAAKFAAFNGDSCVPSDNSADPYFCEAIGIWLNGSYLSGLTEFSNGKQGWGQPAVVPVPPRANQALFENEVSCATVTSELPDCLFVGDHYNYNQNPAQLAEWGTANGFQVVDWRNPKGATTSGLEDVSCPSARFCVTTGYAGTPRKYRATWFTWNGTRLAAKTIPEPARSHDSELGALSCPSTTKCIALGSYLTSAGKSRAYAEVWASGKWRIESFPNVAGKQATLAQSISCPASSECVAAGEVSRSSSSRAFGAVWNGSKWRLTVLPAGSDASLYGVSCPTTTRCFASGLTGRAALLESWNGSSWRKMTAARTPAPRNADSLQHVSCVSPTHCVAVGYRYNPKKTDSDLTLVEVWNGSSWKVQAALNN